eukprot:gene6150-8477_t
MRPGISSQLALMVLIDVNIIVNIFIILLTWQSKLVSAVDVYSLETVALIEGCRGGEVCDIQPSVVVTKNGLTDFSFEGTVSVELANSPTGYESLYLGSSCNLQSCGKKVVGTLASASFIDGVAEFKSLYLKQAGEGYTLRFTGRNGNNQPFAMVESPSFSVSVGSTYKLFLCKTVGNAIGGQLFASNPAVCVTDRGDNTITEIDSSESDYLGVNITAKLISTINGDVMLNSYTSLVKNISNGVATFSDLYINEAGLNYQLLFSISKINLEPVISKPFTVSIGSVEKLLFSRKYKLSSSPKYGGEYFQVTPKLYLLDMGHNRVVLDNSSAVRVSINDNPSGGVLGPESSLFVISKQGVVSFSSLRIDKKGEGYRLRFDLYKFIPESGLYNSTSYSLISEKFDVLCGPPRQLQIMKSAGDAWAGNQAFGVQPIVALTDYGGNVISNDFSSVIQSSVVASLAAIDSLVTEFGTVRQPLIKIYTGDAPPAKIIGLFSNFFNNTELTVGDLIEIRVVFDALVWVKLDEKIVDLNSEDLNMLLNLNISSNSSSSKNANLYGSHSDVSEWVFRYRIENDVLSKRNFTNEDVMYVIFNQSFAVVDGNEKSVNLSIPQHMDNGYGRWSVNIDTNEPTIMSITTNTTDGEYGAGEMIYFALQYDYPVIVTINSLNVYPYLVLNPFIAAVVESINSTTNVHNCTYNTSSHTFPCNGSYSIDYRNISVATRAIAKYSHSAIDNKVLYFVYTIEEGHFASKLQLFESLILSTSQIFLNGTGVTDFNSSTYNKTFSVIYASILRYSSLPSLPASNNISSVVIATFENNYNLSVDTSSPKLDIDYGVQTSHTDGILYSGELIFITVRFDKPVVAFGIGIYLVMECGQSRSSIRFYGQAFIDRVYDDDQTIEFSYSVEHGSNITNFDIREKNALMVVNDGASYIRRKSTNPITAADLNTSALYSSNNTLRNNAKISLNGLPFVIEEVKLLQTVPANVTILYPDDVVYVQVRFSGPIIVTCSPVFVMSVRFNREAIYFSGNGSNSLVFKYTVLFGDSSNGLLGYRNIPNALCPVTGCPQNTICSILANSSHPNLSANILLNKPTSSKIPVRLGNQTIKSRSLSRNTTISNISCRQAAGEYGVGSVFKFDVTFSDLVIVNTATGSTLPKLSLNIGKLATYIGKFGNKENILTFQYITESDDIALNGTVLNTEYYSSNSTSVLLCIHSSGCKITNQAGDLANLTTPAVSVSFFNITLDPSPPVIEDIWSNKLTSEFSLQSYSPGENIDIYIRCSKPVVVLGINPRLELNVQSEQRYALYNKIASNSVSSNGKIMVFRYIVTVADFASNLTYIGRNIDLSNNCSFIYRMSTIPQTMMDVTLPFPPRPLAIHSNTIRVDGIISPYVTNVVSVMNGDNYRAGDSIIIRVDFSNDVLVMGHSYLNLNVGNRVSKATFLGFQPSNYSLNEWVSLPYLGRSNHTSHLYYKYVVEENDFSDALDYTDPFALFVGITDNNDVGYIISAVDFDSSKLIDFKAAAHADLELPFPKSNGSLSGGFKLKVDGSSPYILSIYHINSSTGIYGTNATLYVGIRFSAPVVVIEGPPCITLETGAIDGRAKWIDGNETDLLIFSYTPEPGHFSTNLDYAATRESFLSGESAALQLNGGKILALSANPILPANLHLNPPLGILRGDNTADAIAGVSYFSDLGIAERGPDYLLRYSSLPHGSNHSLTVAEYVDVLFSSEFMLRPCSTHPGDFIGMSVDIDGDIAIIGAPYSNRSVTTIQIVTTSAEPVIPQQQVQSITTSVSSQNAIQSIYSSADVGETIGGYFRITYGDHGSTQPIPSNADPDMISAILAFDLPSLGKVNVVKEPYIYCACYNAFTWTLNFIDINEGEFPNVISIDSTLLTGSGAVIVGPQIIQSPAKLGGSFIVNAVGKSSTPIPYDASVDQMNEGISSMGLSLSNILISPVAATGSRTWSLTFNAYNNYYDIPLLEVNGSSLTGGNTAVFAEIARAGIHGPSGISGTFKLQWRGNTTAPLQFNASSDDVKRALEALPVINLVYVNRSSASNINGYSWTIEFVSVNSFTNRGYVLDDKANLEPLDAINALIATNSTIKIEYRYFLGQNFHIYSPTVEGSFGSNTGSVYIFQRHNESWYQTSKLFANDSAENSMFGSSVAILNGVLLIGAVGANENGVPEKQEIFCSANQGYFKLQFRGWSTDYISFNVTRQQLIDHMISATNDFTKLHSIRNIIIDDWTANGGSEGLCGNNTAIITYFSPVDGDIELFATDTHADIELLTLVNVNLTRLDEYGNNSAGVLLIREIQKGTWVVHGTSSDQQQIGSAYLFRLNCDNISSPILTECIKSDWRQEAQFFPTKLRSGSMFGFAVAVSDIVAVVGAPGSGGIGMTYIYEYSQDDSKWRILQALTDPLSTTGDLFGNSVAIYSNTIAVAAAGSSGGTVYIYKRSATGSIFISSQSLLPTASIYPLDPGDLFGYSISVDKNLLVVGAPAYNDHTAMYLYGNTDASKSSYEDTGAVFVFERSDISLDYSFVEKLNPSNIRSHDRLGHSVDIFDNNIAASTLQDIFSSSIGPSNAVIEITSSAKYNTNTEITGSFVLHWHTLDRNGTDSTPDIAANVTATEMKLILESSLPVGEVLVSRTLPDLFSGGFAWRVTFVSQYLPFVNLFEVDYSELNGIEAKVDVKYINQSPMKLRGNVHMFQRENDGQSFVEQLYLSPFKYQANDRCGTDVALDKGYALIGCPNRDLAVSGQNSGAGFIYDLNVMDLSFSHSTITVTEGDEVSVEITKFETYQESAHDIPFIFQSLDRNSPASFQQFIKCIYGLESSVVEYPRTFVDQTGLGGSAIARSQNYGSLKRDSLWVDGLYDYRGIADYVPLKSNDIMLIEQSSIVHSITTNPDTIVEYPDEHFSVIILTPGTWPSPLGRQVCNVTIEARDSDGIADLESDSSMQYQKMIDSTGVGKKSEEAQFGSVVASEMSLGVVMVSAPMATVDDRANAGKVVFYHRENSMDLKQQSQYFSSPLPGLNGSLYGNSLAITKVYDHNMSIMAVGESSINRVHVYTSHGMSVGKTYMFDKSFSIESATDPKHRFGESVALNGYLLVVGSPGLELVMVYIIQLNRTIDGELDWTWTNGQLIRASSYDYDVLNGVVYPHRQEFGKSVAISKRSLVVGAPFADNDKLGSNLPEDWQTEGTSIFTFGRGRAYVFNSVPSAQVVRIVSSSQIIKGEFQIMFEYLGLNQSTVPLSFDVSDTDLKAALEALSGIDEATVISKYFPLNKDQNESFFSNYMYERTIVFGAAWIHSPPLLVPLWRGKGCQNCSIFSFANRQHNVNSSNLHIDADYVNEKRLPTDFNEFQALFSDDRRNGDRFGWYVAIDQNQIVVGAPYSSTTTSTTWDFETGNLLGWQKFGEAFNFQPTFGDNSYHRAVGSLTSSNRRTMQGALNAHGGSAGVVGRYYIGTYEKRPGAPSNYKIADPSYSAGSEQGDRPIGWIISDVFIIKGDEIRMMVGGGCNIQLIFVELLVDGFSVAKVTGRCNEKMHPQRFDVSAMRDRAAQIRIVDNSTTNWGHINVDQFEFDWEVSGAAVNSENSSEESATKTLNGGQVEARFSGAAYSFLRHSSEGFSWPCLSLLENCIWSQETKFVASDKREMDQFGSVVAVNDDAGILIVGSPFSAITGGAKENLASYPYSESSGKSIATAGGLSFPVDSSYQSLFQLFPNYESSRSSAFGIWKLQYMNSIKANTNSFVQGGAVYVYTRKMNKYYHNGLLVNKPIWYPSEHAKVLVPDGYAGDHFGTAIALSSSSSSVFLIAGASGHDAIGTNAGATYAFSLNFAAVSFTQKEYRVLEGVESHVTITLSRDLEMSTNKIVLEYATSDITAVGVDAIKYKFCEEIPPIMRGSNGCGDYEQSTGQVVINSGDSSGAFKVRIVDDLCYEKNFKFIQVSLSVPGAASLGSEILSAKIRIDDNDFGRKSCEVDRHSLKVG